MNADKHNPELGSLTGRIKLVPGRFWGVNVYAEYWGINPKYLYPRCPPLQDYDSCLVKKWKKFTRNDIGTIFNP